MTEPNIYARMNACMRMIERISKENVNRQFGYKFVTHDDVTMHLRRAFLEVGIAQRVTMIDCQRLEGGALGVKVQIDWVNINNAEDRCTVESYGEAACMDKKGQGTPQQTGIALSYAVKLAQLKNFCLVGDDTPDPEMIYNPNEVREGTILRSKSEPEPESDDAPPADDGPPPDEGVSPKVAELIAGFDAVTTMRLYDKILERGAKVVRELEPEDRQALTDAAKRARERLSGKQAVKESEGA